MELREGMEKLSQPVSSENCVCPSSGHDEL